MSDEQPMIVGRRLVPIADRRPIGSRSGARYAASWVDNSIAILAGLIVAPQLPIRHELARGLSVYVIFLLYFAVSEGAIGATFGKWYFDLCVVGPSGKRCGFGRALIRTIGRILDANPLLLGSLPAALLVWNTRRRQHLGDFFAGTTVVHSDDVQPD